MSADNSDEESGSVFAFGRQQSCLPKALESLFAHPPTLSDFIEIGYKIASYDTFDVQWHMT
jgi:hypothetical protein